MSRKAYAAEQVRQRRADEALLGVRRGHLAAIEKALTLGRKDRRRMGIKASQAALMEACAHEREVVKAIEGRMT